MAAQISPEGFRLLLCTLCLIELSLMHSNAARDDWQSRLKLRLASSMNGHNDFKTTGGLYSEALCLLLSSPSQADSSPPMRLSCLFVFGLVLAPESAPNLQTICNFCLKALCYPLHQASAMTRTQMENFILLRLPLGKNVSQLAKTAIYLSTATFRLPLRQAELDSRLLFKATMADHRIAMQLMGSSFVITPQLSHKAFRAAMRLSSSPPNPHRMQPMYAQLEILWQAPGSSIVDSMQCTYDGKGNTILAILLLLQERLYNQGGLKAECIFRINPKIRQESFVKDELNKRNVHCLASLIKALLRVLPTGVLDTIPLKQLLQCAHVYFFESYYASRRVSMLPWSCYYMTFLIFSHKVKVKDPTPLPRLRS